MFDTIFRLIDARPTLLAAALAAVGALWLVYIGNFRSAIFIGVLGLGCLALALRPIRQEPPPTAKPDGRSGDGQDATAKD